MKSAEATIVPIDLGERSYPIVIGSSLLDDPDAWSPAGRGACAAIVTDTLVRPLYADRLSAVIADRFERIFILQMPEGESHKSGTSLNLVYDGLASAGADRKTVLFALGGGVVGDVAGFAAASYMRGIPLVQVPTTLLAQVDSSVGGKTGVNHPLAKNMIGAFYQPRLVMADLGTLRTLPPRQVSAGLAEVIKYGPIADAVFLDWVEANVDALLALDAAALTHAVRRCCEIKASVVEQDEREQGVRAILNFGHTFGHAIEAGLGYQGMLHGEAVGCGMVMAAELSARLGLVAKGYAARLTRLIERAGLPVRGPGLGAERYLELMRGDKKAEGGELRFVVIEEGGRAKVRPVPTALVREVIASCCA